MKSLIRFVSDDSCGRRRRREAELWRVRATHPAEMLKHNENGNPVKWTSGGYVNVSIANETINLKSQNIFQNILNPVA